MDNLTKLISCPFGPDLFNYTSSGGDEEINEMVAKLVAIAVPIIFGIIVVIGFVGNFMVIVVVLSDPQMRSTTNILILNLAVADLLFVILCVPFTATDYALPHRWPFGNVWCKVVQYLIIVTACSSVYTLVLMSFDRYLAVVHPVRSMDFRTGRNAIIAITIVWLASLSCSVPVILIHGEHDEIAHMVKTMDPSCPLPSADEVDLSCHILPGVNWPLFQVTFFLLSYIVPLLLICGLYVPMLIRLWKSPGQVEVSAKSRQGRKRVTRLVIVVVGVFAFCWCPIQVILVFKSLDMYPLTLTSIVFQITSHVLAYMNSCVNPILYAFLSDKFRKAFRKMIYCRSRPGLNHHGPMTKTTRANSSGDIL